MSALNSFLSEAYSVYTEVTSILASDASNTASATSSSTSSSSSTTTTSSTSSSSSSTSSSTSASSTASQTASATLANAAATSSAAVASSDHGNNNNNNRNLAIILGCVLGALALGLFILVLLLCIRRRKRNRSPRRVLSPEDDEINSWRSSDRNNRPTSRGGLLGHHDHINHGNTAVAAAAAPAMAEHPAFRNHQDQHQNPFVPVPPPPRRTAPNSRMGLTDESVPGQEPYISDSRFLDAHDNQHPNQHHVGEALTAGAGGAALGAAAMHHHNKHDHKYDQVPQNEDGLRHEPDRNVLKKSLPEGYGPVPTTTTNDDVYALNKVPSRTSGDYAHPYNDTANGMRQPNMGAPLSPFNSGGHARNLSHDHRGTELAAGAGLVSAGALAAHHHNRNNSPRRSYDTRREEPHPNALLNSHFGPQYPADDANRISNNSSSTNETYDSANQYIHNKSTPNEMPGDIPTPPSSTRPRRDSQIGTAAPMAAAAAYANDPRHQYRRHSSQSPYRAPNHRRDETPPAVPSRSPRRARFSEPPVGEFPGSPVSPIENTSRGIVGDNGYPTFNTRRASAAPSTVDNSRYPAHLHDNSGSGTTSSSESTWRMSSGMPGSWNRDSYNRRDSNSMTTAPELQHLRNSGIGPGMRNASPRNSFGANDPIGRNSISPGGRRLRLADLRREEEEREIERSRMQGYVGQAL